MQASPAQLVDMLSDPGGWWRDAAQRLLVERADRLRAGTSEELTDTGRTVVAALTTLAADAGDWRTRLRALWTLDAIDAIDPALVVRSLDDPSQRGARLRGAPGGALAAASRAGPIHAAILKRLDDEHPAVQRQLAASLGAMPPEERAGPMVALLERHAGDPIALDAALSSLHGSRSRRARATAGIGGADAAAGRRGHHARGHDRAQQRGERGPTPVRLDSPRRPAAVAAVGAVARGGGRASWRHDAWNSGTSRRGRRRRRCRARPVRAGRAGPGGAYAFSTPEDFARAGLRGGGAGRSELRVSREPAAFSALAAGGGDASARAATVLARVTWPGKPGTAAATPLTSDEQQRFDAGRDIYRNVCQACHQHDGRGQDQVAPGLIGSPLLFAPAGIAARILLNGKEGAIGLMPPIGSALGDEQIASVLTYVRREWGQTGAPVDPATVKAFRASTADRTRPWTDDELFALAAGAGPREK